MGMFVETAIVDYHLAFHDQGKQICIFASVCSKQMEIDVFS
jgi:hypothetical protein